jgi:hypothetical protein
MRLLVFGAALVFIGGLALLTYGEISEQGLTVASLISILVVLLLAVGIIGALRHPPR